MKKILAIGLVLTLVSFAASAQRIEDRGKRYRMEQRFNDRRFNDRQLTRPERFKLRNDNFRYRFQQRRAGRDGFVGPRERRRLMIMRQHNRREAFRFRHNRYRRVI